MNNILCQYCDKRCFIEYSEDIFLKWLVDVLGPVISGVKPAEILSFRHCDPNAFDKLKTISKHFMALPSLRCARRDISDGSTKVLFYHENALRQQLNHPSVKRYLQSEGYALSWTLSRTVDFLLGRFENQTMPHEIGVFLGYPLKDVLGFIGKANLRYQKTQGWQVYGDPSLSDRTYQSFTKARHAIRMRLNTESPLEILAV